MTILISSVERLSTGIPELDKMLSGGIPRGFFVAVTGEPGTGKTILCLHFIWQGVKDGDKCIYVTTEESRDSIIRQAAQFKMGFESALSNGSLIIVDALISASSDPWCLKTLDIEELVSKVIEAKRKLGYGRARLVIDSLSAFWLDKPAMARKYSYFIKKVLSKWDFTIMATSQYAVTTSQAFGWGTEHIGDGILRFRRFVRGGRLRRFILIEKMRQTPHDLRMHEIEIVNGRGLVILGPVEMRREDISLPSRVMRRMREVQRLKELEFPYDVDEDVSVE